MYLPLRVLNISQLKKYLVLEIKLNRKSIILSTLYRSPSQSSEEFENLLFKVWKQFTIITSKKPFLTCILGDFNVEWSRWCENDKSSPKGLQVECLTSYHGLTPVIN